MLEGFVSNLTINRSYQRGSRVQSMCLNSVFSSKIDVGPLDEIFCTSLAASALPLE